MTSIGVTTATASVTPAARPAIQNISIIASFSNTSFQQPLFPGYFRVRGVRRELVVFGFWNVPRKVACELTTPVSLSDIIFLYASKEVKRIAIFGTIPVVTAPSPL